MTQLYEWDASMYDALPLPHLGWGRGVLDRLPLRGDETVLDLGCGTGRDTELLLDRLPSGHVIAVDGSRQMLARLEERLAGRLDRVDVLHADIREPLTLPTPVDAIASVATIHWIHDHDRLFTSLASVLRPGGRLVVEGGGRGNIAAVSRALGVLGVDLGGSKWNFREVEETVVSLKAVGFDDVEVELRPDPIRLDAGAQFEAFLATVVLGPDLRELPAAERAPFVRAVAALIPDSTIDYVRLQISARRAESP